MPLAPEAEILMALAPRIPEALVQAMPRLEWIHALTTGYDNLLAMKALPEGVAISNSRGMHGPQMAELTILNMMALIRRYPAMLDNQKARKWDRWKQPMLLDKEVCIIGLGSIAEGLVERLLPFGVTVTGISDSRREMPGVARIHPRAALIEAVTTADFVVVLAPYSPETHHIVNDAVLAAMKPTACLVNMARGGCVDELAVVRHLQDGSIGGAALDVFATEPLPADSPIWSAPNMIVTPHVGGMSDTYHLQVIPIIERSLRAYAKGGAQALDNLVSRP